MRFFPSLLVAALLSPALATPALSQVSNGGFELPPSAPPTAGEWQYNTGALRDGTSVQSGSFAANLMNTSQGANVNVSQQTLPGSITPNTNYTLSFWSQAQYAVAGEGQLQIGFMNSGGGYLAPPQFFQIPASSGYVLNTSSFTSPAGASLLFLGFNAVTGAVGGASSQLFIDDVRFAVVPEPTSVAALGLSALVLRRRRRA